MRGRLKASGSVVWGWNMGIEESLQGKYIADARIIVGEYHFRVGELEETVVVKLFRVPGRSEVFFLPSHHIKTPMLDGPYDPVEAAPSAEDEPGALWQVARTMTQVYMDAVEKGHKPDATWLVPNANFR